MAANRFFAPTFLTLMLAGCSDVNPEFKDPSFAEPGDECQSNRECGPLMYCTLQHKCAPTPALPKTDMGTGVEATADLAETAAPPDLGTSTDLAEPPDLDTTPDMATSPDLENSDLAMPPDLSPTPDLSPEPDLALSPDLAEPPDLAVDCTPIFTVADDSPTWGVKMNSMFAAKFVVALPDVCDQVEIIETPLHIETKQYSFDGMPWEIRDDKDTSLNQGSMNAANDTVPISPPKTFMVENNFTLSFHVTTVRVWPGDEMRVMLVGPVKWRVPGGPIQTSNTWLPATAFTIRFP